MNDQSSTTTGATVTVAGSTIRIGKDFVEAVSGDVRTHGGATINGKAYAVRSSLGCSDTSDALIRTARKEGARLESQWTQAA